MSYPDVVIACIEHEVMSLKHSGAIEAALAANDINMKDYSLVVD